MPAGSIAQLFGCRNHQFGIGIGIGINPPSELALGVHLVQADLRTAPLEEQRLPGAGKMSRPPTTLQDDACTEI